MHQTQGAVPLQIATHIKIYIDSITWQQLTCATHFLQICCVGSKE